MATYCHELDVGNVKGSSHLYGEASLCQHTEVRPTLEQPYNTMVWSQTAGVPIPDLLLNSCAIQSRALPLCASVLHL